MPAIPYTIEQKEYLRAHYATATREEIMAQFPGRYWKLIQNQAGRIGLTGALARQHAKRPATAWTPTALAYLRTNYPTLGPVPVASFTGLTMAAVRSAAAREGIRRLILPKPAPAQKRAKKVAQQEVQQVAKAAVVKFAGPLLAVKRSSLTPALNIQKEARKRRDQPKNSLAEAIARHKTLRYGQPEHTAFLRDGLAGWQQWQRQQAA